MGRFRFDLLPPDVYAVTCAADGYEFEARLVRVRNEPVVLAFSLRRARPLIVRLGNVPAAAIGTVQTAVIARPRILTPNGIRPPDTTDLGTLEPYEVGFTSKATVEKDGTLRFDAPPEGEWHLVLEGDANLPSFETEFRVTAAEVPTLSFEVPVAVEVKGRLEGPDGPLAGVSVEIGGVLVRTDAEGRFVFPRVAPGRHGALLALERAKVPLGPIEVPAEGPAEVVLRTLGTAEVTAFVPNLHDVNLYDASGARVGIGWPDAHDRVRLPFLAAGGYRLAVYGGDTETEERRFELLPGQVLDLGEIRLRTFPVVPVSVTAARGERVPTMLAVTVTSDVGGTRAGKPIKPGRIEVDPNGRGWLRGLPEGRYVVSIQGEGFPAVTTTLDVRAGITTPVVIEFRKP
jgi:hypothetical protein